MTCNAAVPYIPLHWYKLNWPIPCDLPESWTVLSGVCVFFFCRVYMKGHKKLHHKTRTPTKCKSPWEQQQWTNTKSPPLNRHQLQPPVAQYTLVVPIHISLAKPSPARTLLLLKHTSFLVSTGASESSKRFQSTVNLEIFARTLFSQIALKYIFVILKIHD